MLGFSVCLRERVVPSVGTVCIQEGWLMGLWDSQCTERGCKERIQALRTFVCGKAYCWG